MEQARPMDDAAFREMLRRAAVAIDQGFRDHAAIVQLQAWANQLKGEVDAMQDEIAAAHHDAETARAELTYWRSRAGLMLRALRLWERYQQTLAGGPAAKARAYVAARDASQEALAAISPAALQ